ncbi:ankyrin repeat and MYND domain-containing 2 [Brachionus plicatilis]|uniref:Ankyrin repeat and MYND domain-containing 2 n=1 Tax=Brachionus plicatilis TaxID=10195 RepID=A0A3M7R0I4_BRAPC|nr:ankyrin repeat and MYND domain-containing 2 [Brachionus plicatilis]
MARINCLKMETPKKVDEIFVLLKESRVEEAFNYIKSDKLTKIDCVDDHGTTPLQYAAFRGHEDICRLLISKGADVNAKTQDQGYSALMFAAIANKVNIVSLLLDNNADTEYTNVIGRTAAQMASFVNSNESVNIINSYISKESLEYYTECHSIDEKEPKLPRGECVDELHKLLINSSNYSPCRIIKCIKLSKNNTLMNNAEKIIRTLNAFSIKAWKNDSQDCPNDILSFKLHYYKYLFEYLLGQKSRLNKKLESSDASSDEISQKLFELCLKQLVSEEEISLDGEKFKHRVFEEKFLRESIRQHPYKEQSALTKQMVTILAKAPIGGYPSALHVINSCLNGQRFNEFFDSSEKGEKKILECATCYSKNANAKICTHCKKVAYCDQFCQKVHWSIHKEIKA